MTLAIVLASKNWVTQSPTWPGRPPRSDRPVGRRRPTIAGATRWERSRSSRVARSYRVTCPSGPGPIGGVEGSRRGEQRKRQGQGPERSARSGVGSRWSSSPRGRLGRDLVGDPRPKIASARGPERLRLDRPTDVARWVCSTSCSPSPVHQIISRLHLVNYSLPTDRVPVGYPPAHAGRRAAEGARAGRSDPGTALVPGRAVSRPYISQLERDLKSPTLDTLFLLCDALGVSAADLVGRIEGARGRGPRPESHRRSSARLTATSPFRRGRHWPGTFARSCQERRDHRARDVGRPVPAALVISRHPPVARRPSRGRCAGLQPGRVTILRSGPCASARDEARRWYVRGPGRVMDHPDPGSSGVRLVIRSTREAHADSGRRRHRGARPSSRPPGRSPVLGANETRRRPGTALDRVGPRAENDRPGRAASLTRSDRWGCGSPEHREGSGQADLVRGPHPARRGPGAPGGLATSVRPIVSDIPARRGPIVHLPSRVGDARRERRQRGWSSA